MICCVNMDLLAPCDHCPFFDGPRTGELSFRGKLYTINYTPNILVGKDELLKLLHNKEVYGYEMLEQGLSGCELSALHHSFFSSIGLFNRPDRMWYHNCLANFYKHNMDNPMVKNMYHISCMANGQEFPSTPLHTIRMDRVEVDETFTNDDIVSHALNGDDEMLHVLIKEAVFSDDNAELARELVFHYFRQTWSVGAILERASGSPIMQLGVLAACPTAIEFAAGGMREPLALSRCATTLCHVKSYDGVMTCFQHTTKIDFWSGHMSGKHEVDMMNNVVKSLMCWTPEEPCQVDELSTLLGIPLKIHDRTCDECVICTQEIEEKTLVVNCESKHDVFIHAACTLRSNLNSIYKDDKCCLCQRTFNMGRGIWKYRDT